MSSPSATRLTLAHRKRRLPSALIIRRQSDLATTFQFTRISPTAPLDTIRCLIGNISSIEEVDCARELVEDKCRLYTNGDGDGMMASLAMNHMVYPFVSEQCLNLMSSLNPISSGPYHGMFVLYARDGHLSRATLTALCLDADDQEDDDADNKYLDALMNALMVWDGEEYDEHDQPPNSRR